MYSGKCFSVAHRKFFFQNFKGKHPKIYFSYIDDIFGVWEGSQSEFDEFEHFNNFNPSIKFKNAGLLNELNVLDTTVVLQEEGSLKVSWGVPSFPNCNFHKFPRNYECRNTSGHDMRPKKSAKTRGIASQKEVIHRKGRDRWEKERKKNIT